MDSASDREIDKTSHNSCRVLFHPITRKFFGKGKDISFPEEYELNSRADLNLKHTLVSVIRR